MTCGPCVSRRTKKASVRDQTRSAAAGRPQQRASSPVHAAGSLGALTRLDGACAHWRVSSWSSLPIQVLVSFADALTDMPRLLVIRASFSPVRITRAMDHHNLSEGDSAN